MGKFFVGQEDIHSDYVLIKGEDVNHIRNVLRYGPGDRLTVCDGKGKDYLVEIEKFESQCICAGIISVEKNESEPPVNVTLFQGIPKSDKMDFIVQKSVELGVNRIVPVLTARTVVKLGDEKDRGNKAKRWQRIAHEAAKQCNRGIIPVVEAPVDFRRALQLAGDARLRIIPYEKETSNSIGKIMEEGGDGGVAVMIGPEGGFTEEEIESAVESGMAPVTLGPRILRTETAAIAVLSIIMHRLGDVC